MDLAHLTCKMDTVKLSAVTLAILLVLMLYTKDAAAVQCFGRDTSDPNVCSSHGTCVGQDDCDCTGNYFGDDCSITTCFGSLSNETDVCSGRGLCFPQDTCTCADGYEGDECQYVFCNNINATDPNVCNGRGTCEDNRLCNCDTGYSGSYCQFLTCNSVSSKDPSVCSGHGECVDIDTCNCTEAYSGSDCDVYTCYDVSKDDSSVCSAHGNCVGSDECACFGGWTGDECDLNTCFGIERSDPQVCSGHGQCLGADQCNCQTGWNQDDCSIPECSGITANDSSVCWGNGECLVPEACACTDGYFGKYCKEFFCSCEPPQSPYVCSGHGECVGANNCTCDVGYFGENCQFAVCFGIESTESEEVCSGHGDCERANNCNCDDGWAGDECEHPICFGRSEGFSGSRSVVCNGHGTCESPDTCSCDGTFRNEDCTTPYCFGEWHQDMVCSHGQGTCSAPDTCTCDSGYSGEACQRRDAFLIGIEKTVSGKIQNVDEYVTARMSLNTNKFRLFGRQYSDIRISSNGFMSFGSGSYSGSKTTFENYSSENAMVFLSHSDLDLRGNAGTNNVIYYRQSQNPPTPSQRTDLTTLRDLVQEKFYTNSSYAEFDPDWFWVTTFDGVGYYPQGVDRLNYIQSILVVDSTHDLSFIIFNTKLKGISYPVLDPVIGLAPPASQQGSVSHIDLMRQADPSQKKSENFGKGSNVDIPGVYIYPTHVYDIPEDYNLVHTCFGLKASSVNVCSGNGDCIGRDLCQCKENFTGDECEVGCAGQEMWIGNSCHYPVCFGVPSYDEEVCSGHGECTSANTCSCSSQYSGEDCSMFSCFGKQKNLSNVCSGHGTCSAPNVCSCEDGYRLSECESTYCSFVCANGGTCAGANECTGCNSPFFGDTCREAIRYVSASGDDLNDENSCLDSNIPCASLKHAISQADTNNIIRLTTAGEWELPLHTIQITESIIIEGEQPGTILMSNDVHQEAIPHFELAFLANAYSIEFRNVELKNIFAGTFLSVRCTRGSKAVFRNVTAHGNSMNRLLQYVGNAQLEVYNSTFSSFRSPAFSVQGTTLDSSTYVNLQDSTFSDFNEYGIEFGMVLHVENVATVSLSNLVVSNFSHTAVYTRNTENVRIDGSRFSAGSVNNSFTTVLDIKSSTAVSISNSEVSDNFASGSLLSIRDIDQLAASSFVVKENKVQSGVELSDVESFEFSESQFLNNVATSKGALVLSSCEGIFSAFTCNGNTSPEGMCMLVSDAKVTILNSDLSSNEAAEEVEFLSGTGSAISASGSSHILASHSTFDGNDGAISVKESSYYTLADCQVSNHKYGAIKALSSYSNSDSLIQNCVFSQNNNEGGFGGSVTSFGASALKIVRSIFKDGVAFNGGGISSVEQSSLEITDTSFSNLSASTDGGAIYLERVNDTKVADSFFSKNNAENGGAFFANEVLKTHYFLRMGGSVLQRCTFTENLALGDGGAIALSTENIFICESCIFSGNTAGSAGGALHGNGVAYRSDVPPGISFDEVVSNSTFSDLLSLGESAGLFVKDCTFDKNKADVGGAVSTFSNAIRLKIENTTISDSTANSDGGAVYLFVKKSEMIDTQIITADAVRGGCVFTLLSVEPLSFSGTELTGCSAEDGALYLSADTILYFNNSALRESNTIYGGIVASSNTFVENSRFVDNFASNYGACISILNSGELYLSNTEFKGNSASSKGGVVYSSSYDQMTMNCVLSRNNSAPMGGTVYFDYPTKIDGPTVRAVSVDSTSSFEDSASIAGGSFFSYKKSHMAMDKSLNIQSQVGSSAYGNMFASEPKLLRANYVESWINKLADSLESDTVFNLTSDAFVVFPGQYFDVLLDLTDYYDQVVSTYPGLTVSATASGAQLIGSSLEELLIGGKVNFTQLQLYGLYDSFATITFSVSGVTGIPSVTLGIKFVECPRGYRYITGESSGTEIDQCELCPRGSYTLKPFQTDCVYNCPNFDCEASTIEAKTGFWVDVGSDGDIRAIPCPNGKCNGGSLVMLSEPDSGSVPIPSEFIGAAPASVSKFNMFSSGMDLSDANFSSLVPTSLEQVTAFKGSSCDDNRQGILCASCLPGFSEWTGTCMRCETANALMIIAFLLYCGTIILYVHCSSQSMNIGASVKILVSFSQTVFFTIDYPAWARKQEQEAIRIVFGVISSIISLFQLEIPSLATAAADGLNCPFNRPGYWYYSGQLLQHIIMVVVVVLALLLSLCFFAVGCLGKTAAKKKKRHLSVTSTPSCSELGELDSINKMNAQKSANQLIDEKNPDKNKEDQFKTMLDQDDFQDDPSAQIDAAREESPKSQDQNEDEQRRKSRSVTSFMSQKLDQYLSPASFVRTIINMLIFTYQPIVAITFQFFFACFMTGGGVRVFVDRSDLNCWTSGTYWMWSVLFFPVMGYILFFPLSIVLFLRVNNKYLNNPNFKKYFGPLYDIYRPGYYWFEWINFARRAALIGGGIIANTLILTEGVTGIQFVLFSLILSANYVIVHLTNPFDNKSDNFAEKYSLFVTLFMMSVQEGTSEFSEAIGVIFALIVTTLSLIILILYVVRENWLIKSVSQRITKLLSCLRCKRTRKSASIEGSDDELRSPSKTKRNTNNSMVSYDQLATSSSKSRTISHENTLNTLQDDSLQKPAEEPADSTSSLPGMLNNKDADEEEGATEDNHSRDVKEAS